MTQKVKLNMIDDAAYGVSGANKLLQLDGTGKVPAVDISQCTGLVAIPAGAVFFFAAASTPAGFLECNGAAVSRTTYAALFAVVGTTYGAGDGSSTFTLPDLRGEFIRGADNGRGVDTGRAVGSTQSSQNLSHNHGGSSGSGGSHNHTIDSTIENPGSGTSRPFVGQSYSQTSASTGTAPDHTHSISSDGGTESRPRNVAMRPCIKY
jgi:microcystin-dependent protein